MQKGLLLSRKGARGIGSGLIHGYYLILILIVLGESFAIFVRSLDTNH